VTDAHTPHREDTFSFGRNATYDLEALRTRGVAMETLDQLAMEHLLGVR
jgi:hypothetical protein